MRIYKNGRYFACVNARIDYADEKGGTHEDKMRSIVSFDSYSRYANDDGTLLNADIAQAKLYANQSRDKVFKIFNEKLRETADCLVEAKDRETMIKTLDCLNSAYSGALKKIGYGISLSDKTSEIVEDILKTGDTDADDECIRDSLKDYYTVLIGLNARDVFGNTEAFELSAAACVNLSHSEIYPETLCVNSAESASELTVSYKFCNEVNTSLQNDITRNNLIRALKLDLVFLALSLTLSIGGFVSDDIIIGLVFGGLAISQAQEIINTLKMLYPQGLNESPVALYFREKVDSLKYKNNELKNREEDEIDIEYCDSELEDDLIYEF